MPAQPRTASSRAAWTRLACVGIGLTLVSAFLRSGHVTEADLKLPILVALIWTLVLAVVFRPATRILWSRPELLAPIGILMPLEAARQALVAWPRLESIMQPIASLMLWGVGFEVSVPWLLAVALWVPFAAWQTDLLIRATLGDDDLDLSPWEPIRRHSARVATIMAVGALVVMACGSLLMALFPDVASSLAQGRLPIPLIVAIVLETLVVNLFLLAALPLAMVGDRSVRAALSGAVRAGSRNMPNWAGLLAVRLALVGSVTYFSSDEGNRHNWKLAFRTLYLGAYEATPHWYLDYREWLGQPAMPLPATLVTILLLVLAAAVQLRVIASLATSKKPGRPLDEIDGPPAVAPTTDPAATSAWPTTG